MTPKAWTCRCGRRNSRDQDTCVDCEAARPEQLVQPAAAAHVSRRCPVDGGSLGAMSWCERGQGYPVGMNCPFACPLCRHALTWDGRCFACHGTATGEREAWAIPGDQYELAGGHWRKVEGSRECLPPEENRRRLAELVTDLAARLAPAPAGNLDW